LLSVWSSWHHGGIGLNETEFIKTNWDINETEVSLRLGVRVES